MVGIKVKQIALATAGKCVVGDEDTLVTGVSTDSRTIERGMVFFPLKGKRYDGHDFLEQAILNGCSAVVLSKDEGAEIALAENKGVAAIKVEDTSTALQQFAEYYLSLFSVEKIGVTGSTGKTTTKEMLYWILSERFNTVRNKGNYNNLIGLPLSVFQIDKSTEAAVFEMGMDRLGEIKQLSGIVKPHIGIITNIGLSHIEHLGSRENIKRAKLEITENFKADNVLVINGDDQLLNQIKKDDYQLISVGTTEKSTIQILNLNDKGEEGIQFTLKKQNEINHFEISMPGKHNAINAALAVAAAGYLGISMEEAAKGLAKMVYTDKRLHIIDRMGIKIIDDTYNASPDSMKAAINVLVSVNGKRKLAILGDMFELGENEEEYHYQVGKYASETGVDVVISVGKNARHIYKGASGGNTKAMHFESKEHLLGVLSQWIRTGDVILVKGSRGMNMEDIVERLGINLK